MFRNVNLLKEDNPLLIHLGAAFSYAIRIPGGFRSASMSPETMQLLRRADEARKESEELRALIAEQLQITIKQREELKQMLAAGPSQSAVPAIPESR